MLIYFFSFSEDSSSVLTRLASERLPVPAPRNGGPSVLIVTSHNGKSDKMTSHNGLNGVTEADFDSNDNENVHMINGINFADKNYNMNAKNNKVRLRIVLWWTRI